MNGGTDNLCIAMPRPKKPGAPEPKKRSRNGCWYVLFLITFTLHFNAMLATFGEQRQNPRTDWFLRPCKARKVKCDEGRPSCVNCQKQGETCDYSIRLNWDGRGKKKAEESAGSGQINFSSGMISVGTGKTATRNGANSSPVQKSEFNGHFTSSASATSMPTVGPQQMLEDIAGVSHPVKPLRRPTSAHENQSLSTDMSMIDPVLMGQSGPPSYHDNLFNEVRNRPDYQYAQSYERYRSDRPNTPSSVQPPAISRLREARIQDDPQSSAADSGIRSPSVGTFSNRSAIISAPDSPTSTPPFFGSTRDDLETSGSERPPQDRPSKRPRYDPEIGLPYISSMPPPASTSFLPYNTDLQGSVSSLADTPATPASIHSDDPYKARSSPRAMAEAPDLRRLSVNSLLSGPPGMPSKGNHGYVSSDSDAQSWPPTHIQEETTTWGIDSGFKDLDIGKNDDMNALVGSPPTASRDHLDLVLDEDGEMQPVEFGFGMKTNDTAFENGGYYDKPVPVSIPRVLEPLPNKLLENPMNLLVCLPMCDHIFISY